MNKLVKTVSYLLAVCLMMGVIMTTASAEGDANVVIGTKLVFEAGNEPFIMEERTMMPLRAISEALNATVYWFNDEKRIQIVCYDTLLSLQIDNDIMGKYAIVNGEVSAAPESIQLDVAPIIQNDRTYVPLRAISEAFDATITWDNPNRAAIIIPNEKAVNTVSVSEMANLQEGTLCAATGVIGKDATTGLFYIRSLTKDANGEYARMSFCTPKKTSISDDTDYNQYVSQYWLEQLGSENPSGMVIRFTGVTALVDGTMRVVINKTTTGVLAQGHYDNYMKALGFEFEPFDSLTI